jgi:hypothetical protein
MQEDRALTIDAAEPPEAVSVEPQDLAAFVFQMSSELASMADAQGLSRLAAALELTRSLAAEALAIMATSGQPNAAPEDAA